MTEQGWKRKMHAGIRAVAECGGRRYGSRG